MKDELTMNRRIYASFLACALMTGAGAIAQVAAPKTESGAASVVAPAGRSIEVCFVLDTTGSMGGLIDGAKRKIWSIANSIVATERGAHVRFALVPYRDRGDEYITKVFDLSDDLDDVFSKLQSFQAGGGGDGPESVNQALNDAVTRVAWSRSPDVVKLVFLVGDAPPHMDYADDVKYPDTCQAAVKRGLIINTVQCGSAGDAREVWEKVAKLGEGSYVALEQSGGMVTIEAPQDKEIADLSNKIAALSMPYGSEKQQAEVNGKNAAAAAAPAAVAADRAAFNASSARAIQGRGDLVSDLKENTVKLDDIKNEELPKDLQNLPRQEQLDKIQKISTERDELAKKVSDLARQRQAYIEDETKKQTAGKSDAFDAKVSDLVKQELERKK
jgi:hypothetical protein